MISSQSIMTKAVPEGMAEAISVSSRLHLALFVAVDVAGAIAVATRQFPSLARRMATSSFFRSNCVLIAWNLSVATARSLEYFSRSAARMA